MKATIRPSAVFKNYYREMPKQCEKPREAVITKLELLGTLAEAEDDVKSGRTSPMQNSLDDLRLALLEFNLSPPAN
jgi:hypothetical protein